MRKQEQHEKGAAAWDTLRSQAEVCTTPVLTVLTLKPSHPTLQVATAIAAAAREAHEEAQMALLEAQDDVHATLIEQVSCLVLHLIAVHGCRVFFRLLHHRAKLGPLGGGRRLQRCAVAAAQRDQT